MRSGASQAAPRGQGAVESLREPNVVRDGKDLKEGKNVGSQPEMRIGVDVGGTKIEALAIDLEGKELLRYRVDTPKGDYEGTVDAIKGLVNRLESETGKTGTVGAGIPGSISRKTGLVKNANSTWLNGMPFDKDLSKALEREVRLANDANCLAVSEAIDGAAAGNNVVFGVILGTGCGGGVAIDGKVHAGPNGDGGEWGHIALPWPRPEENPGPICYCGKPGCMEMWASGTGLARDYKTVTGKEQSSREIVGGFLAGDPDATAAVDRLEDRLARGLASIVNILDPDAFVIGGGLSNLAHLYESLPGRLSQYVFGGEFDTPILQAKYGDSSGVRGAAWLWPLER